MIKRAHKIRLNPTPEQEQYFWRAAGIARFAYNWGLENLNLEYEINRELYHLQIPTSTRYTHARILKKAFNRTKPNWVREVTTWAYQGAFDDLQAAVKMFWERRNGNKSKLRKDGKPEGWPRFKSRRRAKPAFYIANAALKFDGHFVTFDKRRVGPVNMTEQLRFDGKVLGGRITHHNSYWWLSVQVELEHEPPEHNQKAVELDLGVRYLAVASDGTIYHNPRALIVALRKLRRYQRKLDRQRRANNPDNYKPDGTVKSGPKEWIVSNNMKKTETKITRIHLRIKCLRQEASHQMTTEIARKYGRVIIEDLKISEMLKDNPAAKYLADAALYEKRRQLAYKTEFYGGQLIIIDRFEPSNKKCSVCGYINNDLKIGQLYWQCPECEVINHKYTNSLKNIRELASPEYLHGDDEKRPGVNS